MDSLEVLTSETKKRGKVKSWFIQSVKHFKRKINYKHTVSYLIRYKKTDCKLYRQYKVAYLHFQLNDPAESQIPNNYVNMDCQNSPASLEFYLSLHVNQMTFNTKFKYFT